MFSDKTGTLTENDMQFRECSVDGTKYIVSNDDDDVDGNGDDVDGDDDVVDNDDDKKILSVIRNYRSACISLGN